MATAGLTAAGLANNNRPEGHRVRPTSGDGLKYGDGLVEAATAAEC